MLPPPPNTREKITLPESGIVFEYLFTWLCVGMKLSIKTRNKKKISEPYRQVISLLRISELCN